MFLLKTILEIGKYFTLHEKIDMKEIFQSFKLKERTYTYAKIVNNDLYPMKQVPVCYPNNADIKLMKVQQRLT